MSRPQVVKILGREYLLPTWYPAPLVTGLALVDQGRRLVSRAAEPQTLPALESATIVIAKPDHFGDLIQATALFRALRDQLPAARLVLVHGSWAREVGRWLVAHDYVHDLVEYDAAWLQSADASWTTRLRIERDTRAAAATTLRAMRPAVYLDIRCTSPSTINLAVDSGARVRIGFGLRGRSWQYHQLIPYRAEASLGQNWLHALDILGLAPVRYRGPVLPDSAPLAPDAPIIVQPGSRTSAKEAPPALWQALVPGLARRAPLLLVGNASDRERFAALRALVPADRLIDAMGTTSFAELVALTGRARAAVGVESMVAHLAVGYQRPTVVLNSPKASGIIAFPDGLPSLTFVDMTTDPRQAADLALAHLDRCLA
ncbi:MAG: glycosyltransferase family 9 protein [Gemmatimonadaceae bacterium]|nr:glycosyltransferase family 9 protein [Gemmatimonadaceae bacterium]